MSTTVSTATRVVSPRSLIWLFHIGLPLVGLWLLIAQPGLDLIWEDHFWHFWLVFVAAGINVVLAVLIGESAFRNADARLYLVSLSFLTAAGFLSLHALATPGIILSGPNAGFQIATPIGLLVSAGFALASAVELPGARAAAILRLRPVLTGGVFVLLAVWQLVAMFGFLVLDRPLQVEEASGAVRGLAVIAVGSYLTSAALYYRRYRRNPSVVSLGVITAFALLAEAMIAMSAARSWHASWWEWHILMTLAFAFVAYSVHVQYRREGQLTTLFRSISLEETVRRLRDEYAAALEDLVESIEEAADSGRTAETGQVAARLSERFGLSEGQADVLLEAAGALASERREVRKLGLFRRYLSPEVAAALLADPAQAELGGTTTEVTVLFADMRGFTSFSERTDPADVVTLLNTYFGAVVPIILDAGGTVIQFIGDAIMAIFNAPVRQSDHPLRAARAALAFQAEVDRLAVGHDDPPRFRVGIATGPALVGNLGSDEVRSFSAIGDTVNLAARLQTWAQVGQVVVSAATAQALTGVATLRPVGALELKGKAEAVEAWELVSLDPPGAAS